MISEERDIQILAKTLKRVDVYHKDGHFIYSTGNHGSVYIDKNKLFPHPVITNQVCEYLGKVIVDLEVDAIIGPSSGGIILSQGVARYLSVNKKKEVLSLYMDKVEGGDFKMKRNYNNLVKDKNVIIVDDGILTGKTIKKIIQETLLCHANILAVIAIFKKANLTAVDLGVPLFMSIFSENYDETTWSPAECPLCKNNIPVNLKLGQAKKYLNIN